MKKRYAVFTFYDYYPGGGWTDFTSAFETREEAVAEAKKLQAGDRFNNAQIVDLETLALLQEF